jgi:3-hydroxyisobutyrate dehydrogenase-like beta-hydroxyacid dehydrogenase
MNDEVPGLGWLGTGRMGAALAGRLIDAGLNPKAQEV